jgi:hypothetical protein
VSQLGSIQGPATALQVGQVPAAESLIGRHEFFPRRASLVFGLGATLCEILTGLTPFNGENCKEIYNKAARGDLADAFHRLDTGGADAELISLARECLAPDRQQRLCDALQVTARTTA